jgi:tripartite-type tricarboxylate transporter receptor subunit TctC
MLTFGDTLMLARLVAAVCFMLTSLSVFSQESFPNRPISVVVPFPPGGMADLSARPLSVSMEQVLKQPVVVINKAGASGAVGIQNVANAKPDGYTIMVSLVSFAFPDAPTLKELGYDVEFYVWSGVFAPKGVPEPTVAILRDAVRKAVSIPEFKTAMAKVQTPIAYLDAPEFQQFLDKDTRMLSTAVKRIGRVEEKT